MDGDGFLAMYNSYECMTEEDCVAVCGDYSSLMGTLTSPFYPKAYPDDTECVYTISQAAGTFINMTIIMFDISVIDSFGREEYYCKLIDFLEIRDGPSQNSSLIGRFCGTNIPSNIVSTQNLLWIR